MRRALAVALLFGLAFGQQARFRTLDVYVDAGEHALAAWQVEIEEQGFVIAGVEGGAYGKAPYFDPAALRGGRIVIADFRVEGELPKGRVHVARLHVMESAPIETYRAKPVAAARPGGERIDVTVEIVPAGEKR